MSSENPNTENPKGMPPRALINMLGDIEQRSLECARNLKVAEYPEDLWQGLVFTLCGVDVISDMHEVSELLRMPEGVTRVPGAKPWLIGVANVRGNLLTLVDLQAYLGGTPVVAGKNSRVLVVQRGAFTTGLLVPGVKGMREFELQHRLSDARVEGAVGAYVYDGFQIEKDFWPVFNMRALVSDPRFSSAAI